MPFPTPFHSRTAPLCESQEWRNWAGFLAAASYEPTHEREYYAIRNAAALIDVSPLYKYELRGPEALAALNRIVTRDVQRCSVGQVMYTPWCDDDGKVIDDGTLARLESDRFRLTAAEDNYAWLLDCCLGLDVEIRDVTSSLAVLAIQGPNSRRLLEQTTEGIDFSSLRYYHLASGNLGSLPATISRTGYTGDLGYELWLAPGDAVTAWDILAEEGSKWGALPVGMAALDIARIEAGLIMLQVDYISARKAVIRSQMSSPFEIGLGWAVDMKKGDFIGRRALLEEQRTGSKWKLVGLELDWGTLEAIYAHYDLAPQLAGRASRLAVPVYRSGRQVGQATSHTFSPILKKSIAIATILTPYAASGRRAQIELTVEYVRHKVDAEVVPLPFFAPPRKRA